MSFRLEKFLLLTITLKLKISIIPRLSSMTSSSEYKSSPFSSTPL